MKDMASCESGATSIEYALIGSLLSILIGTAKSRLADALGATEQVISYSPKDP